MRVLPTADPSIFRLMKPVLTSTERVGQRSQISSLTIVVPVWSSVSLSPRSAKQVDVLYLVKLESLLNVNPRVAESK
eukprot:48745-Eustigmatos_ZCMA.PRE.1